MENQMTRLRPMRSLMGPPARTPTAFAPRKRKSRSCEVRTVTPNVSMV